MSGRGAARRSAAAPVRLAEPNIELQIWLRLLACANLVSAELRQTLRRDFAVTLPVFDLLAQVARPPLGPTMGELSRRLMVSKGNVTELVERLGRKGLVMRSADARDARVQRVYLTGKGRRLFERLLPAHNGVIRSLMADLPPARMAELSAQLNAFKALLRARPANASADRED